MPFVAFTGVNHHYHPIFFGFAVLSGETESTFVWLFDTWLESMNNKAPLTIITNQNDALANAIVRVFPTTHHALCSWHIKNKCHEKLYHVYASHPTFKSDFKRCVYKSLTIEEFENRWKEIMEKYSLSGHKWLQSLYAGKREMDWGLLKEVFCRRNDYLLKEEGDE